MGGMGGGTQSGHRPLTPARRTKKNTAQATYTATERSLRTPRAQAPRGQSAVARPTQPAAAAHCPVPTNDEAAGAQTPHPPPPTAPAATSHDPNPQTPRSSRSSSKGATGTRLPKRACPSYSRPAPRSTHPSPALPPQEMLVVSSRGHCSVGTMQAGGRPRACQCAAGASGHGPSSAGVAPSVGRGHVAAGGGRRQREGRRAPTHAPVQVVVFCRRGKGLCRPRLPSPATVGRDSSSAEHLELKFCRTALGTLM